MESNSNESNVGYTIFKATGVRHEFSQVDLVKKQVTCIVIYKDETYMTVIVDLKTETVQVEGDVDELGELSMDKNSYIDMFRQNARFFIDNNISNPKEYYDEIIKKSN